MSEGTLCYEWIVEMFDLTKGSKEKQLEKRLNDLSEKKYDIHTLHAVDWRYILLIARKLVRKQKGENYV